MRYFAPFAFAKVIWIEYIRVQQSCVAVITALVISFWRYQAIEIDRLDEQMTATTTLEPTIEADLTYIIEAPRHRRFSDRKATGQGGFR